MFWSTHVQVLTEANHLLQILCRCSL